ncbi:MAG: hypothetical protein ACPGES_08415 [Coraliomargarita sp.]
MCRTAVKLSAVYGILFLVDEITTAEHVFSSATPSAMLTTGNTGDWTQVGRQNLDHTYNDGNDKPREVKDAGSRAISGMALELSDFTLTAELGGGQLTSAYADQIVEMTLLIGGSDPDGPKTDMGFVSSDINSIRFTNQVPEMSSSALLLGLCVMGHVLTRRRR